MNNDQVKQELDNLQIRIFDWATYNFPDKQSVDEALLGMIEELGELSHAVLKAHQGIRGSHDKHMADIKDSIADMFVYCCQLCTLMNVQFSEFHKHYKDNYSSPDVLADWTLHKFVFEMSQLMGHFVREIESYKKLSYSKSVLPELICTSIEMLERLHVNFEENLIEVANEVLKRDWIKYPIDGTTH